MLTDLPPLPEPDIQSFGGLASYSHFRMHAYGQACQAATLATVTPLVQQREPMFYTVLCENPLQGGTLALPAYSSDTEDGVLDLVLAGARREGFDGTAQERMAELGWRVGPVFA